MKIIVVRGVMTQHDEHGSESAQGIDFLDALSLLWLLFQNESSLGGESFRVTADCRSVGGSPERNVSPLRSDASDFFPWIHLRTHKVINYLGWV